MSKTVSVQLSDMPAALAAANRKVLFGAFVVLVSGAVMFGCFFLAVVFVVTGAYGPAAGTVLFAFAQNYGIRNIVASNAKSVAAKNLAWLKTR
jgi:hypothetical protein